MIEQMCSDAHSITLKKLYLTFKMTLELLVLSFMTKKYLPKSELKLPYNSNVLWYLYCHPSLLICIVTSVIAQHLTDMYCFCIV